MTTLRAKLAERTSWHTLSPVIDGMLTSTITRSGLSDGHKSGSPSEIRLAGQKG
jgi:hypothetical protein